MHAEVRGHEAAKVAARTPEASSEPRHYTNGPMTSNAPGPPVATPPTPPAQTSNPEAPSVRLSSRPWPS
ncbi:hypothetical protein SVAN01_07407 [Stagonosporopsis vannaccii]|nr:hypothetical protein SVAN01_07407 [Stagonosporopsis vannaccii]